MGLGVASIPGPCGAPVLWLGHRNWCALNSRLCSLQGVQGLSHYKLDGDGGIQFLWGCDLGLHCIISRSDDIISRTDELISRSDDII